MKKIISTVLGGGISVVPFFVLYLGVAFILTSIDNGIQGPMFYLAIVFGTIGLISLVFTVISSWVIERKEKKKKW